MDETLKDMVLALKKESEELKGELTIYKAALSNGMLSSRPKQQAMDVPKPEKFKGARSWHRRSTDEKRGGNAIGTWEEFQRDELMLQIFDLSKKEAFSWFEDGLKPWAKHELRRQGITELTVAMVEAESFVELGLAKD
ncbi:hypothetical protein Golax_000162 [Gossypium laxum]|uniref:Uncharacterized protein n=1 Tax=Gossypium laxum TaxID=34288 RepID=A0A7J9AST4_9ROSI|nr:hypothetical protein [Gossypium laxum]